MANHDWKLLFDNPDVWGGPDKARWCGNCGALASTLADTEDTAACAPPEEHSVLLREFADHGNHGFEAVLYVGGEKLCAVADEGRGGSYLYRPWPGMFARVKELKRWARVKAQVGSEALDHLVAGLADDEAERLERLRIQGSRN
jgi:hypothetical protein